MTYSYTFKHIENIGLAHPNLTLIWILHADKIPPHIGISVDGYFFSLKTEGKDENIPLSLLITMLKNKKITTVAVALEETLDLVKIRNIFENQTKIPKSETCLLPILQLLNKSNSVSTVSELLKELEAKQQIKAFFGLNLYPEFKGLHAYSAKEIQERINNLRNA